MAISAIAPGPLSRTAEATVTRLRSSPLLLVLQAAMLLCTLCTTTAIGMRYMDNFRHGRFPLATEDDIFPFRWAFTHLADWRSGLPFSLTLLCILLAHELGHYIACRRFRIAATLPFVLPAPTLSGTAGAVIRLRQRVGSRTALMVIGAAGPLAGFVVIVFTVTLGLLLSTPVHYQPQRLAELNSPLLVILIENFLTHARHLSFEGPLLWHPVLLASWMGLLITSLNLIPGGVLDGGHIVYALSPRLNRATTAASIAALITLAFMSWFGWLLWGIILMTPAMRHHRVRNHERMQRSTRALAPISFVIFALCLTPQPLRHANLIDVMRWFHR